MDINSVDFRGDLSYKELQVIKWYLINNRDNLPKITIRGINGRLISKNGDLYTIGLNNNRVIQTRL